MNSDTLIRIKRINEKMENSTDVKLNQYKNNIKAIIVGKTGFGKTSLKNCLTNKSVNVILHENMVELEGEGIKSGNQSGTQVPEFDMEIQSNICFIDTAGDEDTNGDEQEIINSLINHHLFKQTTNNNRFKILLVVCESDFNNRCIAMKNSIEKLIQMFPNQYQLKQGIGLVISKCKESMTKDNYLNILNDNPPPSMINWASFFKENPDRVFLFPKPSRENVGSIFHFNDQNKIIRFLQENQMVNPTVKIFLGNNGKLQMENAQYSISQQIENTLRNIFDIARSDFLNENCSSEIQSWLNLLKQLRSVFNQNSYNLKNFFNNNFPYNYQYNNHFDKLIEFEEIYHFIDKSLESNKYSIVLQDKINKSINDIIPHLENHYSYRKSVEENERKRIENEEKIRLQNEKIRREEEEAKRLKESSKMPETLQEMYEYIQKNGGLLKDNCDYNDDDDYCYGYNNQYGTNQSNFRVEVPCCIS